jgi:hypothetical protein
VKSNPDLVDESVGSGDHEGFVHVCGRSAASHRQSGQDREPGPHVIALYLIVRGRDAADDAVLRPAVQAAAQMISGEPILDTLLDPGAVRGEGHRVAIVADQRVDVGLCGRDPRRVAGQLRSAR